MSESFCDHCGEPLSGVDGVLDAARVCPHCGMGVGSENVVAGEVMGERSEEDAVRMDAGKREGRWWVWPVVGMVVAFLFLVGTDAISAWSLIGNEEEVTWRGMFMEGVYYPVVFMWLAKEAGIALIVSRVIAGMTANERRPMRRWWPRYFAVALVLLAGWALVSSAMELSRMKARWQAERDGEVKREMAEIANDVRSFMRGTGSDAGLTGIEDLKFESEQPAITEAEQVRELLHSIMNASLEGQKRYWAALAEAGSNGLLDVARLEKDEGMKESREILAKMREVMRKHRGEMQAIIESMPERVEASNLNAKAKKAFLTMHHFRSEETLKVFHSSWDLEEANVELLAELIAILEEAQGKWQVEDGTIIFSEEEHMNRYNAALNQMEANRASQMKVREEKLEDAARRFEEIGDEPVD